MTTAPTPKKSNTLVITLATVGGVLLLAVVALVFLLIGRGTAGDGTTAAASPTPTVTASPTPTPTPTTEPAPEPEDTSARFTSFDALTELECPNEGDKPEILVSWTTANAVEVWYTSGNEDAKDDNYMQVPLNGSQADFTDEHLFPCAHRGDQDYTLTLVGPNGEHVSEHWTVVDLNWEN